MLYAYKNPTQIDLVVSEAGLTDFTTEEFNGLPDDMKAPVFALVGDNSNLLPLISPKTYADSNSPYTILAYGTGCESNVGSYDDNNGDGIVSYAQPTVLQGILGENNCPLFELTGVDHNDFGADENRVPKKMHPESTESGPWNQARAYYYEKIRDELT